MKQLVIKPGSIMLWKSYGKLKRWWYKFLGKKLPYNNGILIRDTQTILYGISEEPFSKESEVVILEPRKQYSKVETAFLNSIVYASSDNTTSGLDKIGIAANSVRPETFDMYSLTLDNIINNKYYKVIYGSTK